MIDEHEPAFFERPFRERKQGTRAAFRNRSASDFALLRAVLCVTSQAPSGAICESITYIYIYIYKKEKVGLRKPVLRKGGVEEGRG